MNIKKVAVLVCVACSSLVLCAHHHHYHHHHGCGRGYAIGAGILGAGLLASAIYDATHPVPYYAPAPVVVTPAPVVVPQPVIQQPVVQQPVVNTGHYETRTQSVWVEGRYVEQPTGQGTTVRTWQPGHYEQQQSQVWVP